MRRSGATIRYDAGRLLVFAGALAAAWSALTLVSGGFAFHAGPLGLSSRDPVRPLLVGVILLASARLLLPRSEFGSAMRLLSGDRDRLAARIACAAAAGVLIFSIAWNTHAAGGSDSSCYVLQAEAFAHGRLVLTDPLSQVLPGATPAMFAPTGFVPSRMTPFAAVPICGPGLALAMTAASVAGRDAVFLVVPVFAALAVWLMFVLGRRLLNNDDGVTGACAAVLLATSSHLSVPVGAADERRAGGGAVARGARPSQPAGTRHGGSGARGSPGRDRRGRLRVACGADAPERRVDRAAAARAAARSAIVAALRALHGIR